MKEELIGFAGLALVLAYNPEVPMNDNNTLPQESQVFYEPCTKINNSLVPQRYLLDPRYEVKCTTNYAVYLEDTIFNNLNYIPLTNQQISKEVFSRNHKDIVESDILEMIEETKKSYGITS